MNKQKTKIEAHEDYHSVFTIHIDSSTYLSVKIENLEYFVESFAPRSKSQEERYDSPYAVLAKLETDVRKTFFEGGYVENVILENAGRHTERDYIFLFNGLYEIEKNQYEAILEYNSTAS